MCMSKNKMSGEYLTVFVALHDDGTGVVELQFLRDRRPEHIAVAYGFECW